MQMQGLEPINWVVWAEARAVNLGSNCLLHTTTSLQYMPNEQLGTGPGTPLRWGDQGHPKSVLCHQNPP